MSNRIKLCILPGYACNFKCAHCSGAFKKPLRLTEREFEAISRAIAEYQVTSLHFVGGEPTLYMKDINRLLAGVTRLKKTKVRITTNGYFGASKAAVREKISSFLKLDYLQLSYDKFHERFLPFAHIKNIYDACLEAGVEFSAAVSIQDPLDLTMVSRLKKLGDFPVGVLKVMPAGAAEKNSLSYRYPSFDGGVLRKKCPNRRIITYMCGEGFTSCCSLLSFGKDSGLFSHPTMRGHLESGFYRLMERNSFGDIMRLAGISRDTLGPEHSSPCTLCAHLFSRRDVRKLAGL